jgi:transcriptional accessory protein Tex/SPT6
VVYNFVAQENAHFVDDQELNPIAFAEQFTDPDAAVAQPAEELLRRARMILATELGKDPLLRQAMRDLFKTDALISVLPTERGMAKIDEHHPYFVSTTVNSGRVPIHLFFASEFQVPSSQEYYADDGHATVSSYPCGRS